jgi:hypothetical protein
MVKELKAERIIQSRLADTYFCRLATVLQSSHQRLNVHRFGSPSAFGPTHFLKSSVSLGSVKHVMDLFPDMTRVICWGERHEERGSPFSTMMSRALRGLYPLTSLDLLSGLFLLASDFIVK